MEFINSLYTDSGAYGFARDTRQALVQIRKYSGEGGLPCGVMENVHLGTLVWIMAAVTLSWRLGCRSL